MITLYLLKQSRAHRIVWALEELGLDYEVKIFDRDPQTKLAPAELKNIHPLGKSPILTDGDLTLAESGAIVQYLVQKYGNGCLQAQEGSNDYYRCWEWVQYAEGSIMAALLLSVFVNQIAPSESRDAVKAHYVDAQMPLHLAYVENALRGKTWLVGEKITAADIMMSFPLQLAMSSPQAQQAYPNIAAYVTRIEESEGYRKAEARVGKLELLKL